MDIWIRSQDREKLEKTFDTRIFYDEEVNKWAVVNSCDIVGYYDSKERALEVLDDIERHIYLKEILNYNAKETMEVMCDTIGKDQSAKLISKTAVYEMPKE